MIEKPADKNFHVIDEQDIPLGVSSADVNLEVSKLNVCPEVIISNCNKKSFIFVYVHVLM